MRAHEHSQHRGWGEYVYISTHAHHKKYNELSTHLRTHTHTHTHACTHTHMHTQSHTHADTVRTSEKENYMQQWKVSWEDSVITKCSTLELYQVKTDVVKQINYINYLSCPPSSIGGKAIKESSSFQMFYFCIQLETSPTSPAACNWKLTPTTPLCSTGKFHSYFWDKISGPGGFCESMEWKSTSMPESQWIRTPLELEKTPPKSTFFFLS